MANEKDGTELTAEQIRARRKRLADQRQARQAQTLPTPEEPKPLDEVETEEVITEDIPLVQTEQLANGIHAEAQPFTTQVTSETAPEATGNIDVPDHGDDTIIEPVVFPGATVVAEGGAVPADTIIDRDVARPLRPVVIPTQVFPKEKTPEPETLPPAPQAKTEPEPTVMTANPMLGFGTGARALNLDLFRVNPRERKTPVVKPDQNLVIATTREEDPADAPRDATGYEPREDEEGVRENGDDGEELPDETPPRVVRAPAVFRARTAYDDCRPPVFRGPTPRYARPRCELIPPDLAAMILQRKEMEARPNLPDPTAPATPPAPAPEAPKPMDWADELITKERARATAEAADRLAKPVGEEKAPDPAVLVFKDPVTQRVYAFTDTQAPAPAETEAVDYTAFEVPPPTPRTPPPADDQPGQTEEGQRHTWQREWILYRDQLEKAAAQEGGVVPPQTTAELVELIRQSNLTTTQKFNDLGTRVASVQYTTEALDERISGLNEKVNGIHDQIAELDGRFDTLMITPRLAPAPEHQAAPPPVDPFPRMKEGLDEVARILVRHTDRQTVGIINAMTWRVGILLAIVAAVFYVVFAISYSITFKHDKELEISQLERDIALLQAIRGLPESCDQGSIEVKNGLIVKKNCQPMTSQLPEDLLKKLQARLDQLKVENRGHESAKPVLDTYQRTEPATHPQFEETK